MPNVELNAQHFEDMITRRGIHVQWEQAHRCSCWSDNSGQPLYSCKACGGTGYIYSAPMDIRAVLIMALVMSKDFTPVGDFRMGDCVATVPQHFKVIDPSSKLISRPVNPMFDLGEWDKVTLMDTEFRCHESLMHGTTVQGREPDVLRNEKVTNVLSVLTADSDTGEVSFYEPDVDFKLVDNKIDWLATGTSPAIGQKYSVMYYYRPVYVVYTQLPQSRDPDGQHFPKKVVLRYRDVALNG